VAAQVVQADNGDTAEDRDLCVSSHKTHVESSDSFQGDHAI
jgi:hypothetical protein